MPVFVRDVQERAAVAFVAAFAAGFAGDLSSARSAALGGLTAAATVVVGAVAALFGTKGVPSLDPANKGVSV